MSAARRQPAHRPRLTGGRDAADRLPQHDRDEIESLRDAVSILDVSEALQVQIHDRGGLTCPEPEHHQTGASAPAWVYTGDDGTERWHCACGAGGDVFEFVIAAGHAENFREALEAIRTLAGEVEITGRARASRAAPRRAGSMPPEQRRWRGRVRSGEVLAECRRWAAERGWDTAVLTAMLGPDRWAFVWDDQSEEPFLRVYADEERTSWQDRSIRGGGSGPKWRSAYGRAQKVFLYGPQEPVGRPLAVEGAADFLTMVVAQEPLVKRFEVVGLPGAGRGGLLPQRPDWCVVLDNDDAGISGRERIDVTQDAAVRHLHVPAEHHDLNDVWTALTRHARIEWIHDLIDMKDTAQ